MQAEVDYKAEALDRIDAMAEKLGVVSAHLWEVLVAAAYGEALAHLLLTLAGLSMGVWMIRKAVAIDSWFLWEGDAPGPSLGLIAAGGLLTLMSLIVAANRVPECAAILFSPEYGAWLKVLEVLK